MNKFLVFFLILLISLSLWAETGEQGRLRTPFNAKKDQIDRNRGLTVTPVSSSSIDQLINTLLGDDISAFNVMYTGTNNASGLFEGGISAGLDFEDGIILSCGSAANAIGPNTSSAASTDNSLPGDPDLTSLIPGYQTYDATVLEFDFIPDFNSITFTYIFASEEYPEWVGSSFNDVFGFFLDGVNIAIIPGTNIPVAINNVNENSYSEYYVNNHALYGTYDIECDGFTVELQVNALVTPGQVHHIRLGIADAGDHVLDSWVFLKAESFISAPAQNPFVVDIEGGVFHETDEDIPIDIAVTATGLDNANFLWILSNPIFGTAEFFHGRLTIESRIIRYTPNQDYNGYDTFALGVFDGYGGSIYIPITVLVVHLNDPPVNTIPPEISGDFMVGNEVYLYPGEWNDDADNQHVQPGLESTIELFYQWQRSANRDNDWDDIPLATGLSYLLQEADAEHYLRCMVTAVDDGTGMGDDNTSIMPSNEEYCEPLVESNDDLIARPATGIISVSPNPFNPSTEISFEIAESGMISLYVYDLKGRKINTLIAEELAAGYHSCIWTGNDYKGSSCNSGIYFAVLEWKGNRQITKLMLIK
ncbi:MAG: choice-of-anchor L domain-containing protein [Candidatus Cloacimonetes bacterium]|nr:choice-of-anchor L domain-containing protein [Candidatus Cloacimonadota bacterium]